jgi:hypothetical protein
MIRLVISVMHTMDTEQSSDQATIINQQPWNSAIPDSVEGASLAWL